MSPHLVHPFSQHLNLNAFIAEVWLLYATGDKNRLPHFCGRSHCSIGDE